MTEEYETEELTMFKQEQTLEYPRQDSSKYDTNEIKTCLTENELDFYKMGQ
jgi:hypothetical protein